MDDLSFRLGNRVLGNAEGAAGLECTRPARRCASATARRVCVDRRADDRDASTASPVPLWQPVDGPRGRGARRRRADRSRAAGYVAGRAAASTCPTTSAARSTFTLGALRRPRRPGAARRRRADGRRRRRTARPAVPRGPRSTSSPASGTAGRSRVLEGPHAAPEFFTRAGHRHAARHRLGRCTSTRPAPACGWSGPKPQWARTDGGEAGLHPSNIHDNAYSVGAVDFTGDMPISSAPTGRASAASSARSPWSARERWKLGQLAPGDTVRFVPVARRPGAVAADASTSTGGRRCPPVISTVAATATTACSPVRPRPTAPT